MISFSNALSSYKNHNQCEDDVSPSAYGDHDVYAMNIEQIQNQEHSQHGQ